VTAKALEDDRGKCLEAGATDYLAKPVDTANLLELIHHFTSGSDSGKSRA
jgi:CheY-like chemotaxis protein